MSDAEIEHRLTLAVPTIVPQGMGSPKKKNVQIQTTTNNDGRCKAQPLVLEGVVLSFSRAYVLVMIVALRRTTMELWVPLTDCFRQKLVL